MGLNVALREEAQQKIKKTQFKAHAPHRVLFQPEAWRQAQNESTGSPEEGEGRGLGRHGRGGETEGEEAQAWPGQSPHFPCRDGMLCALQETMNCLKKPCVNQRN